MAKMPYGHDPSTSHVIMSHSHGTLTPAPPHFCRHFKLFLFLPSFCKLSPRPSYIHSTWLIKKECCNSPNQSFQNRQFKCMALGRRLLRPSQEVLWLFGSFFIKKTCNGKKKMDRTPPKPAISLSLSGSEIAYHGKKLLFIRPPRLPVSSS